MRFEDIHGTDRIYEFPKKEGAKRYRIFAITGYGSSREAKREKRFRHLIDLFKIEYTYRDEKF